MPCHRSRRRFEREGVARHAATPLCPSGGRDEQYRHPAVPGRVRGRHAAGQDDQPERARQAQRRLRCDVVAVVYRRAVVTQGPVVQFPAPEPARWRRRQERRPASAATQRRGVPVHGEPAGCGRCRRQGVGGRPGNRTVHNHTKGHDQARPDGLDADVQRAAAAYGAGRAQRIRTGRRAASGQPRRAGPAVLLGDLRRGPGPMPGLAVRFRRQLALFALRQFHRHTLGRFHGQRRSAQVY